MTYDQPNEMLRFVWRNESFRFRGFGRVRVRNETDDRPMGQGRSGGLRTRRPSKGAPLAGFVRRSDAQHRVSKGGQKRPTPSLRLWSIPVDKLRAGFRGRPAALQNEVW
jgi:hypothetical protein